MNASDATRSGPNRLRTSDTEREQVAEMLRAAMAEGRLTLEEGEERLGQAYAARFRDELVPLTADLPTTAGPRSPRHRRHGPRHAGTCAGTPAS